MEFLSCQQQPHGFISFSIEEEIPFHFSSFTFSFIPSGKMEPGLTCFTISSTYQLAEGRDAGWHALGSVSALLKCLLPCRTKTTNRLWQKFESLVQGPWFLSYDIPF